MKRHAYMILAHHEFDLLQLLVSTLDDERNDIFIHFDLKVPATILPSLEVKLSRLYIIQNRIDVRWGDVSVVEAEYALFEAVALSGNDYTYCHLLSGVDLPLKSQDYIHTFFEKHEGFEFVGYYSGDNLAESIDRKVRCYHPFAHSFKGQGFSYQAKRVIRALVIRLQLALGFKRHQSITFKKGTQWVSITKSFLDYILSRKDSVLQLYKHTFCSDEIFIQTLLWNSHYQTRIFDSNDESRGCMRHIGWKDNRLEDFTSEDLPILLSSGALWARKFNTKDPELLVQLTNRIQCQ